MYLTRNIRDMVRFGREGGRDKEIRVVASVMRDLVAWGSHRVGHIIRYIQKSRFLLASPLYSTIYWMKVLFSSFKTAETLLFTWISRVFFFFFSIE